MRLLLDSNVLLSIARRETGRLGNEIEKLLAAHHDWIASTASIWEIAIKHRLGKLHLDQPIEDFPSFLETLGCELIQISPGHAVEELLDAPNTKDPFDRMLLAQCQMEGMRLVTTDRALARHPLVWAPA